MRRSATAFSIYIALGLAQPAHSIDVHRDLGMPKIGGDVGKTWEQGKTDIGNAAKTIGQVVQEAAPIIVAVGCPMCAVVASQLKAEDKAVVDAIVGKGMVLSVLGPVFGTYSLTVIAKEEDEIRNRRVPIRRAPSAPTGKELKGTANCIVQFGDRIEAYTIKMPEGLAGANRGDRLVLTAPLCNEYANVSPNVRPVTSATIVLEGFSEDQLAKSGELRFTYVGKAA